MIFKKVFQTFLNEYDLFREHINKAMETKKRLFFPLTILCLGMILCVTLTSIFFSITNSKKTSDSSSTLSSISFNIYFLTTNKVSSMQEAVILGKDSMVNDNSGYVWNENDAYYLISSAYKNENDATLVKNKLENEGINSQILKISFPSIKISTNFSNKEREVLTSALNAFHNAYISLYDTSISLDNKLINQTNASLNINSALANFNTTKNNFETLFKLSDNEFVNSIKNYLIDGEESLNLLFEKSYITPTQTYSSLIKYRYCEILHINYNLLIELSLLEF